MIKNHPAIDDESHAWPQTLRDLVDIAEQALQPDIDARIKATNVVSAIAEYHGGRMFYLPKGDSLKRALRDQELYKEFNGVNIAQLVQKYRLSHQRVYKIIEEQRKININKRQMNLSF